MRRRKKNSHEEENHERWLISYADFITLLFAFFVVLYATSNADDKKQEEFQKSIKKYFLGARGASSGGLGGVGDYKKHSAIIENPIHRTTNLPAAVATLESRVLDYVDKQLSQKDVDKYVQDIHVDKRGVRFVLNANLIFAKDSTYLNPQALPFVGKLAKLIQLVDYQVIVENHLVGNENSKPYASVWELSSARSTFLARYFIKKYKVAKSRLIAIGFGDSRPQYSNSSQSKNARVELLLNTVDL